MLFFYDIHMLRILKQFYILLLAVAKTEAIALKSSGAGNGQNRCGVQTATEQNNCFFLLSAHLLYDLLSDLLSIPAPRCGVFLVRVLFFSLSYSYGQVGHMSIADTIQTSSGLTFAR